MSGQESGDKQVISQETFIESVLETKELLELSTRDALLETIQQFEIMGVDLTYIEKTEEIVEGNDQTALLVEELKKLCLTPASRMSEMGSSVVVDTISRLQSRCLTDSAVAKRSCDLDVRQILLEFIQKDAWPDVVKSIAMTTLAIINKGYQTALTTDEIEVIFEQLRQRSSDGNLFAPALKWLLSACKKHEKNKQAVYDRGFTNIAVSFFQQHVSGDLTASINELEFMTKLLQTLSSDDDLTEETPKFFERATELALKLSDNLLVHTAQLCDAYVKNERVSNELSLAFNVLSNLAVRDEYCKEMADKVSSNILVETLRRSAGDDSDTSLAMSVLSFLEKLARNDNVRASLGQSDIFELLEVILMSTSVERTIWKTLLLISGLTLRNEANSLRAQNLISPMVNAMQKFDVDNIQMAGIMGLYNIINKKELEADIKQEIEGHAKKLVARKSDLAFHAKKVLNAIGAPVDVVTLWTGERGDIVGGNE